MASAHDMGMSDKETGHTHIAGCYDPKDVSVLIINERILRVPAATQAAEKPTGTPQFCGRCKTYVERLKWLTQQTHRTGEELFVNYARPSIGPRIADRSRG